MNKLKIYLCDLIHSYYSTSDTYYVVPLNIGYIGAYLKNSLGDAVRIKLFKYPDKLVSALKNGLPDVIGFSFYIWNEELVLYMAKKIKEIKPNTLVVLGGPNMDISPMRLTSFLKDHPYIDYYISFEGEETFACLVKNYINIKDTSKIKNIKVNGAATYNDGLNYYFETQVKNKQYINYPSPYLTGIMDEFINDPYLYPLFETNRGCPFSCAYCVWGSSVRNHMRVWPLKRVFEEFNYVIKHGANQKKWIFADSNFGIYERDIKIAERIQAISQKSSGVKSILAWSSKNTSERNVKIAEILGKLNGFLIAFQTLDKEVLLNIKRYNIKESSFVPLINYFKTKEADIETDILIGLPGETFKSHLTTIRKCFDYDIRNIKATNIRLLTGSAIASEEYRKRFGIKTKHRLNKDCYGNYWGEWVIDPEEIICSTDTMSESEMLKLRLIHFFIWLFWNKGFLQPLILVGKLFGINPIDQILSLIDGGEAVSHEYVILLSDYMRDAKREWFETKVNLINFYRQTKDTGKSLREFNFLNFKYTPKIIFSGIFLDIANFLENFLISRGPSIPKNFDLKGAKEFTIKRLCLNLAQVDESRKIALNKIAYEFFVNEKIIPKNTIKAAEDRNSYVKLHLKNRGLLIDKIKSCKKENGIDFYEKIITVEFLRNLIYTACD